MFRLLPLLLSLLSSGIVESQLTVDDLVQCEDCDAVPVMGGGDLSSSDLANLWSMSYSLVEPDALMIYTSGVETSMTNLLTACKEAYVYDYALQTYRPDKALTQSHDLLGIPLFVQAFTVTYNIPFLTPAIPVNLSRSVLSQIYSGNITKWDDKRIMDINPSGFVQPFLKGQNITLVLRTDPSGITRTLLSLLESTDPDTWNTSEVGLRYSTSRYKNFSNVLWAKDQFSATSFVLTTVGAIGANSLSFAKQAGLAYANLINQAGKVTKPIALNLKAAADTLDLDNGIYDPTDAPGNASYPLTAVAYALFHGKAKDCESYETMMKFWHWCLTDTRAQALTASLPGFVSLPDSLQEYSLSLLETFTCNGNLVLETTFVDNQLTVIKQFMICVTGICLMFTITVLATLVYKRKSKVTKAAGFAFAVCFLLGCIINYLAIFFWALSPSSDAICQLRYVFVLMGYCMILGSMFSKSWELNKVFTSVDSVINPMEEVPWWKFIRVFGTLVASQGLLILIWMGVDAPHTISVTLDSIEFLGIHQCVLGYPSVWVALELIYFALLLGWGAYLAYQTRDIWVRFNYPNESKSILLSIYNLAFCGAILVPLMTTLEVSEETLFFLVSFAILWPTSFALCSVYIPKVVKFIDKSYRERSNGLQGSKANSVTIQNGGSLLKAPREDERKLLEDMLQPERAKNDETGRAHTPESSPSPRRKASHLVDSPDTSRRGIARTESTECDPPIYEEAPTPSKSRS